MENTPNKNVYQCIAQVSGELAKSGISKDNKNLQQGYKFRGIDDIYNALAPMLSEVGLVILPRVISRECTERTTKNGGALFYTVVEVEFDFVSSQDNSKHTVKIYGEAMDSADKSTNKAMSAAYKYMCLETFCIPTEGDNDADATTHEVAPTIHEVAKTTPRTKKDVVDEEESLFARSMAKIDSMNLDELTVALTKMEVAPSQKFNENEIAGLLKKMRERKEILEGTKPF